MAWRSRCHHLDRRAPRKDMLAVAARTCGLHAQLMSSAELTLWARVEGLRADDVATALWQQRTLFKTWAMRGTLHLLPSSEYGLWQGGLGTRQHYLRPVWLRGFGVTREQLDKLLDAIPVALDGKQLTRDELATAVSRLVQSEELGDKLRGGFGPFLKPAAFRGDLCFAPSRGQNVCFARPGDWLGAWQPVAGDQAMLEITRRYFSVFGPATREDYARWWGTQSPAEVGKFMTALGDELSRVDVEGDAMSMLTSDVEEVEQSTHTSAVRLLPAFDQYVAGNTKQADHLLAGGFKDRVFRPQGWISPVLLVDGRMDGTWEHERKGGRVEVRIAPFVKVSGAVKKAAAAEAERLADFFGGTLDLAWAGAE